MADLFKSQENEFYIILKEERYYVPGDYICGDVVLDLKKPTKTNNIKLSLEGVAELPGQCIRLFTKTQTIAASLDGQKSYLLGACTHRFPFRIQLPDSKTVRVPSTLQVLSILKVYYKLVATYNKAFVVLNKLCPTTSININVLEDINVERPELMGSQKVEKNILLGDERAEVSVTLGKRAIVRGDVLPISISLKNNKNLNGEKNVTVELLQYVYYGKAINETYGPSLIKSSTFDITILDLKKSESFDLKFMIPKKTCPTVDKHELPFGICYYVQIKFHLFNQKNEVKIFNFPLIIGTYPKLSFTIDDEDEDCSLPNDSQEFKENEENDNIDGLIPKEGGSKTLLHASSNDSLSSFSDSDNGQSTPVSKIKQNFKKPVMKKVDTPKTSDFDECKKDVLLAISKLTESIQKDRESANKPDMDPSYFKSVSNDAFEAFKSVQTFILRFKHLTAPNSPSTHNNPSMATHDSSDSGISLNLSSRGLTFENNDIEFTFDGEPIKQNIFFNDNSDIDRRSNLNQEFLEKLQLHTKHALSTIRSLHIALSDDLNIFDSEKTLFELTRIRDRVKGLFATLTHQVTQYIELLNGVETEDLNSISNEQLSLFLENQDTLHQYFAQLLLAIQLATHLEMSEPHTIHNIGSALRNVSDSLQAILQLVTHIMAEKQNNLRNTSTSPEPTRISSLSVESNQSDESSQIPNNDLKKRSGTGKRSKKSFRPFFDLSSSESLNTDILQGESLGTLVDYLTAYESTDFSFNAAFLLTYRTFCTSVELLEALKERYSALPPKNFTPERIKLWNERTRKPIQSRIHTILKSWMENYYYEEDLSFLECIKEFINTDVRQISSPDADRLIKVLKKRMEATPENLMTKAVVCSVTSPEPIYPKDLWNIQLLDIDVLEMARQLSISNFKLYIKIRPIELLDKAWCRKIEHNDPSINVKQAINFFERLSTWVGTSIVGPEQPKRRAAIIKYWVKVAEICLGLNNFNTCSAIVLGINMNAIIRLRKTWELVSRKTVDKFTFIRKQVTSHRNYRYYKSLLRDVTPPCIPILDVYTQDIKAIEDGDPDYYFTSEKLINFEKKKRIASIIFEIKQFQLTTYSFQQIGELQEFIRFKLAQDCSSEKVFSRSLHLEPDFVSQYLSFL